MENAVGARIEGGRIGRWIVGSLVNDQVTDRARLRVKDESTGLRVRSRRGRSKAGGSCSAGRKQRVGEPRQGGVGGAELGLSRYDVVEGPVDRSQAIRQFDVWRHVEKAFERPWCASCFPRRLIWAHIFGQISRNARFWPVFCTQHSGSRSREIT